MCNDPRKFYDTELRLRELEWYTVINVAQYIGFHIFYSSILKLELLYVSKL
jgi:hypothetical protein